MADDKQEEGQEAAQEEAREEKQREYSSLLEASAIGWMFPLAIGLGFLWGYGMDKLFGTWPWLTGIFTTLGIIAAFINLFRMAAGKNG